jgi:hypothetical protein
MPPLSRFLIYTYEPRKEKHIPHNAMPFPLSPAPPSLSLSASHQRPIRISTHAHVCITSTTPQPPSIPLPDFRFTTVPSRVLICFSPSQAHYCRKRVLFHIHCGTARLAEKYQVDTRMCVDRNGDGNWGLCVDVMDS